LHDVTVILQQIASGDEHAEDRLLDLVYTEMRRVAAGKMKREAPGQTLQATELVHEAWLRMGGDQQPNWENRAHFYAAAAESMRRILVDRARRRRAARHSGGQVRVDLNENEVASAEPDDRTLAVDEALAKLAVDDPQKAQLVKLRYFGGLSLEEAADALSISIATATRWWTVARARLAQEIHPAK
jgi:RNA polymerase sigma factor (TIGR02999 family)